MIEVELADEEDFKGDTAIKLPPKKAIEFLDKVNNNTYTGYDEENIIEYLAWHDNPVDCVDKCRNLAVLENAGLIKSDIFRSIYSQAKKKTLSRKQVDLILNSDMMKLAGVKGAANDSPTDRGPDELNDTEQLLYYTLNLVEGGMEVVSNNYNKLTFDIMKTVLNKRKGMSSKQLASIYFFMERNKDVIYEYVKLNSLSDDIIKQLRIFLDQYSSAVKSRV